MYKVYNLLKVGVGGGGGWGGGVGGQEMTGHSIRLWFCPCPGLRNLH